MKTLPVYNPPKVTNVKGAPSATWLKGLDRLLLLVPAADVPARLKQLPASTAALREFSRLKPGPGAVFSSTLSTPQTLGVIIGVLAPNADAFQALTVAGRVAREAARHRPERVGLWAPEHSPATSERADWLLAAVLAEIEPKPQHKRVRGPTWQPQRLTVAGHAQPAQTLAVESGAHLARWLTQLPPNILTPTTYRRALSTLAKQHGWGIQIYDERALKKQGAGAFLAVSQGSARRDAALVHLSYRPRRTGATPSRAPIALVGKGLCFDTGGLNIKSAKSMLSMHGDMGGSAVALGTLLALTQAKHPEPVDAWLALAENRVGPDAYTQQDVVTAANGTSIQVVHTDAEGRMVLADTLAIASRTKPACILDFATLTGACVVALGDRLSGVFTNRPALRDTLEAAGHASGERVWALPMPEDFDEDLQSPIADVMQCLIDGKADHIYATRFLSHFVNPDIPWIHVDLSAAERSGGLAHIGHAVTGFGVRFATTLLADPQFTQRIHQRPARR
jgi:leucyl aminopeptidase